MHPLTDKEIIYLRGMIKRDKEKRIADERQIQAEIDFDDAMNRDIEWGVG